MTTDKMKGKNLTYLTLAGFLTTGISSYAPSGFCDQEYNDQFSKFGSKTLHEREVFDDGVGSLAITSADIDGDGDKDVIITYIKGKYNVILRTIENKMPQKGENSR